MIVSAKRRYGRVCCICGRRTNMPTYGYKTIIDKAGLETKDRAGKDKAHPACIRKALISQSMTQTCPGDRGFEFVARIQDKDVF